MGLVDTINLHVSQTTRDCGPFLFPSFVLPRTPAQSGVYTSILCKDGRVTPRRLVSTNLLRSQPVFTGTGTTVTVRVTGPRRDSSSTGVRGSRSESVTGPRRVFFVLELPSFVPTRPSIDVLCGGVAPFLRKELPFRHVEVRRRDEFRYLVF